MKKSILSLLLAVIFAFGATEGMVNAFAETKRNEETPIAQIENDDYVPYNYNNVGISSKNATEAAVNMLDETTKSMGGSVEYYSSREEYSEKSNGTQFLDEYSEQEEVVQKIKVMTTATGDKKYGNYVESKPIKNAIVRINGVPRFTDRNGEIKVTVNAGYAELFVEKEEYNKYIEIFEFNGEDKTIYLKKPQDDIYLEYAMFNYNGDISNVLIQDSYFSLGDEYYVATLDIKTNVEADEYRFYCDSKLIYSQDNGSFYLCNLEEFCNIDSQISVQAVYDGIESDIVNLNIHIMKQLEQNDICDPDSINVDLNLSNSNNKGMRSETETDILGKFKLDLTDLLKRAFQIFDSRHSAQLNFTIDRKKGTVKIILGYSCEVRREEQDRLADKVKANNKKIADPNTSESDRKKLQEEARQLSNKIKELDRKDIKEVDQAYHTIRKELEKVKDGTWDSKHLKNIMDRIVNGKVIKQHKPVSEAFLPKKPAFTVDFQVLGAVEYSLKENKFVDVNLSIGIEGHVEWKHQFVVVWVPMFFRIGGGLGLEFKLTFVQEIEQGQYGFKLEDFLTITITLSFFAELGVGFCDLLSASARFDGALDLIFKPLNPNYFQADGHMEISLRIKALLWSFNIELLSLSKEDIFDTASKSMKLSRSDITAESICKSDNQLAENIYDVSQPKLTNFHNKQILTWIEYSNERDIYNNTVLMYSVFENGEWSIPKAVHDSGKADFDYDIYCDLDGDLHIAWQTSKTLFDENDTLETMSTATEIYVADFSLDNCFKNIIQVTSNDEFDGTPRFVKQENKSDPVSLIWRKNTLNNILGYEGSNYYVYCNEIVWNKIEQLCTFDTQVSFGDAAFIDGNINAAFIIDEDGDLFTNDANIYICTPGSLTNITNDSNFYSSLKYIVYNGEMKLQFIKESKLYAYSQNKVEKITNSDFVTANTVTFINDERTGMQLAYFTMRQESIQQLYCSFFDSISGVWSDNLVLTNEEYDVVKPSIIFNSDGSLSMTYYVTDYESDQAVLCYQTRSFNYDCDIEDAYIDENIILGQNFKINIRICNTGDLPLTKATINLGKGNKEIAFDKPLKSQEYIYVEANYVIENYEEDYISIKAILNDEVCSEYLLHYKSVDYELIVEKTIESDMQIFRLKVNKYSELSSDFIIKVRVSGEEIFSQSYTENDELILTYSFDKINSGDLIIFELVTTLEDNDLTNNKIGIISSLTENHINTQFDNIYSSVMINAKGVCY
jgi:hypothetical protein